VRIYPALVAAVILLSAVGLGGTAQAAEAFAARDAAVGPEANRLYAAPATHGGIAVYSPGRAAPVAQASGPRFSALAIAANGETLAALSFTQSRLFLYGLPALEQLAVADLPPGPADVCALPGGGFAVANAFDDSMTVVDPARSETPVVVDGIDGAPALVAAGRTEIAVAARAPAALHIFKAGARTPSKVTTLPGSPLALAPLGEDFAVAVPGALMVIGGQTGNVLQRKPIEAAALAETNLGLAVLTGEEILLLDARLNELDAAGASQATQLAMAGTSGFALSAAGSFASVTLQENRLSLGPWTPISEGAATQVADAGVEASWEDAGLAADAPVAREAAGASPAPSEPPAVLPEVIDAAPETIEPRREPAVEPQEVSDPPRPTHTAAPAAEESAPAEDEVLEPEPLLGPRVIAPPTDPGAAPDGADQEIDIPPQWQNVGKPRFYGTSGSAPRFGGQRPGLPGQTGRRRTIGMAIGESLGALGREGGFKPPDMTKDIDVQAESVESTADGALRAEGNVRLKLDNTQAWAERLYYHPETGSFSATGNVVMRQPTAYLEAQHIQYRSPPPVEPEEPAPTPPLQMPGATAETSAFARGSVQAEELYVAEPFRELRADDLYYDFEGNSGYADGLTAHAGPLYLHAEQVRILGPADIKGEELWITTCNQNPPHYRIRVSRAQLVEGEVLTGDDAQLEIGNVKTPIYWPRWAYNVGGRRTMGFDFDSGRAAELGYYIDYAQYFMLEPEAELGLRFYPTEKQGIGFGVESVYDYMDAPASPLFRSQGEFRSMLTTKNNGRLELYHRQELTPDTVALVQMEQWFEPDFVKDFYYDEYRDRTQPRTFVNVTHTKPNYIAAGTVRVTTNDFVTETERLPELSLHLLERPLTENLYFSFDSINGYLEREPSSAYAARSVNVARLTYDLDFTEALSLTPFFEVEGAYYSHQPEGGDHDLRYSAMMGATLQTRFHKVYEGGFGFAGFKHVVLPSLTLSYRPRPNMSVDDTPRFDSYDNVYGRTRLETKVDNMLYGRDEVTGQVWQVARLSLYQGTDFWNELRSAEDYEIEMDIRPRPWWGFQLAAERHRSSDDADIDSPYYPERRVLEWFEDWLNRPVDPEILYQYNAQYGDYDRLLGYFYYDDTAFTGDLNARVGFAYTKTRDQVFTREVLYGAGYRINDKWSIGFEHRYNFETSELYRQVYEVRRNLHCWEAAFTFRDRDEGWDVGFELSLVAFPGTKLEF
jgi:lipopolysaccharide assembly outer membrane protein LptD (OstA)